MTTPLDTAAAAAPTARDVIRDGGIRSVFQPIVNLDTGRLAAFEALARGPEGPLATPDALFDAARRSGVLAELDVACRAAAFTGARDLGLLRPLTIFVNVEPEVLETASFEELVAIVDNAPGDMRFVIEITERALSTRPAELLRAVQRIRDLGWGIALDDVGAQSASLAFMPFLRPDVVKLDLRLVQHRPSPDIAEIMNAVNAYAERTGALILAEGIETEQHLRVAQGLGATLGQGWLFGRPAAVPSVDADVQELVLPARLPRRPSGPTSLFSALPDTVVIRRSPKRLLIELSKQLEREGMRLGKSCVVAATFQHGRFMTVATRQRYRDLVERAGFVCALAEGLEPEPVPGLRGAQLHPDDPVIGEWDLVVVSPHFSAALIARDLGDTGPDMERTFEYALTYERDTVVEAARGLLARVVPEAETAPEPDASTAPVSTSRDWLPPRVAETSGPASDAITGPWRPGDVLLDRALDATTNGVTIADLSRPDQPLIYVNRAFASLAGFSVQELVGRNCRFLQGPDTDLAAVARLRDAVRAGREGLETLLNYRGPEREEWWNEVHLRPVTDDSGRVVQFIGVQNDVTKRVLAERALQREADLSRGYLARIEQLAYADHLTGLMNRRRIEERVEMELWEARVSNQGLALLFLDLDGFKQVNDQWGHLAGDDLLRTLAPRLTGAVRRSDMVARLGGDEFLVALTGLDPLSTPARAAEIADVIAEAVSRPVLVDDHEVSVTTSVGISTFPDDGEDFGRLLHTADSRMYKHKRPHPR